MRAFELQVSTGKAWHPRIPSATGVYVKPTKNRARNYARNVHEMRWFSGSSGKEMRLFFGKQRGFDLWILTGGVEVAGSNPVSPILLFAENNCVFNRLIGQACGKVKRANPVVLLVLLPSLGTAIMDKPIRRRGKSASAPSYRLHKRTGQAVVSIHGKDFYLGKYGTEESQQRYKQTLADHWNPPGTPAKPQRPTGNLDVTILMLAIEFGKYAKRKYDGKEEWKYQIKPVLKIVRATYGHLPASEFGPIRFENFRQSLVQQGLSRDVVRRKSDYVVRMFRLGVTYELIPVEFWQRLVSVGPVEMPVKPKRKVLPVDHEIVKATQKELTPILSDMVELHRLIGARPSEVCNLRPCDIDRTGDVWVYTPATHKTENKGHRREINIGPKAQAVLSKYLLRDEQAYCFTPAEAYEQHYKRRGEARETPANHGNRPKPRKQKTFRPNYNKDSYRRTIDRAAMRAFPMTKETKADKEKAEKWKLKYYWKPNQLRHSAATSARKECDLETAQILLGHSSKSTTERFYAQIDNDRAVEFARKFG